jgi:hypothetical protein
MAIIQATVADSELAGMRLKVKLLPNIHCSRIQEKSRRLRREKPATPSPPAPRANPQDHIRAVHILSPGQPWMRCNLRDIIRFLIRPYAKNFSGMKKYFRLPHMFLMKALQYLDQSVAAMPHRGTPERNLILTD